MGLVISDGVEIAYEILNSGGPGLPVFFIAGLGGARSSCMKQAVPFSNQRPVVLHDHRGTGNSAKPLGVYSVENMAADVPINRARGGNIERAAPFVVKR